MPKRRMNLPRTAAILRPTSVVLFVHTFVPREVVFNLVIVGIHTKSFKGPKRIKRIRLVFSFLFSPYYTATILRNPV
jgi:hypothetical protein